MSAPVVESEEGKIRGCVGSDIDGNPILSFLGIPFGKPAIGHLRFKAPEPVESWDGVLDATKVGPRCCQMNIFSGEILGSEDCLNLNVFTRKLPTKDDPLKPVMVWIHGGAFLHGSNETEMFGPEFLMTADIVLVTVNYRLGFLGFLSLQDNSLKVPGNAGLKDQNLALRWVQRNIKNFNGDPNNVTLFGESAGAASVHYQLLSPANEGLFHKVILQSGSALNPWAETRQSVVDFVKFMGKDVNNEKAALQYLQNIPAETLVVEQQKFIASQETGLGIIGPVVENSNESELISERPLNLLKSGSYRQIPMIIGYCSHEGLIAKTDKIFHVPHLENENHNLDLFIPWIMNIEKDSDESKLVCEKLANIYFKEENIQSKYLLPSDFYFISGIVASALQHANTSNNPVYLYRMDLDTDINFLKVVSDLREYSGCCHADDLGYVFNITSVPGMKLGEVETKAMRRCVELWTNFARYGNPTPPENKTLNIEWKPIEPNHLHYLSIENDGLFIQENPDSERMDTWRDIYNVSQFTSGLL